MKNSNAKKIEIVIVIFISRESQDFLEGATYKNLQLVRKALYCRELVRL